MASVFKRSRRQPVPTGAEIIERDGKRLAAWVDGKGKRHTAPLMRSDDKILLPPRAGDAWYVAYDDAQTGRRITVRAHSDKAASADMGKRLEREAARRAEGTDDPFDQHKRTPIRQLVDEFIGNKRTARAPQVKMHLLRIIDGTGCAVLNQLDAPKVSTLLKKLQVDEGLSDTTVNEYVASIKSFARWAVTNRRLPHDPLVGLERIKAKHVQLAHKRRAISLEDLGRLLKAARARPLMELLTVRTGKHKGEKIANIRGPVRQRAMRLGEDRRLAYMMGFWLRLRRSEIKALLWSDVHLDTLPPRITLRAHTTKAKRADSVPMHQQLADALSRRWAEVGNTSSEGRIVPTVPDMKCFRADLAAAGIPDKDEHGAFVDLHSLGKSLVTALAAHGVSQRSAQAIARHSDPRLTAGTYTDVALLPLASELAKVPPIPDPDDVSPAPLPMRATGTDGKPAKAVGTAPVQRTRRSTLHNSASGCTSSEDEDRDVVSVDDVTNGPETNGKCTKQHDPAPSGTGSSSEAGEGGRTLDIHVGNVTLYH